MSGILREIEYQIKLSIRNKGYMFWAVLFPILLSIFYYTAFGTFLFKDIEDINLAIEENSYLREIFDGVDIINPIEVKDIRNINDDGIDIAVDNDLNIYVKKRGVNETIVKSIVDQIIEMKELNLPYENYDFSIDYIEDRDEESNPLMIAFFSLIGMSTFYAAYGGNSLSITSSSELSNIGARKDLSSLNKSIFIFSGFIANIIMNIFSNILLLLFIKYILRIDLFKNIGLSLVLLIFGNVFGAAFGMFVGGFKRGNYMLKESIIRGIMLTLTTFAGMTGPDIKNSLDINFPNVNKLNPIALITDNFYRVNILNNSRELKQGLTIITLYSILLLLTSYFMLRRKKYDSI